MNREPNRIKHTYDLTDVELRAAVRAYLGLREGTMSIEWDAYGDTAEAQVTVTVSESK